MQTVHEIALFDSSQEEQLPGFSPDFPYIATRAELEHYPTPGTPWHWHPAVELFYLESGTLEYTTPAGKVVFSAGSGGFVNAGVLHTSRPISSGEPSVQLIHLFLPELISGSVASRLDSKYVRPLLRAGNAGLLALHPSQPQQAAILEKVRTAFTLEETQWGYELNLRQALTDIWLDLYRLVQPESSPAADNAEPLKAMMHHIHLHFSESISVEDLAKTAHVSKRGCFRLFQENLHMTPVEYITGYRLEQACQMLSRTEEPITQIAYRCGFGSGSYFGMRFRETYGCSPAQFRRRWQDRDSSGQK